MEEIKVGEYIRTSSGTIGKVGRIEGSFLCDKNDMLIGVVEGVVKNSPNIIDLVEERRLFRWCKN